MFNNNFEYEVHEVEKDDNGNKLLLDITIEGKRLTLINIYGPNRDDPDFYQGISNSITKYNNPVILAGDFNFYLSLLVFVYEILDIQRRSDWCPLYYHKHKIRHLLYFCEINGNLKNYNQFLI